MIHTNKYDRRAARHAVPDPLTRGEVGTGTAADMAVPDRHAPGAIGGGAALLLGTIFVAMACVGTAGGWATYHNMKTALGKNSSDMALGLVAAGEGVVGLLGLSLIALTVIRRPYPLPLRLGLWAMPVVGAVIGVNLAHDDVHRIVYAATPLAMTAAAELAGHIARSIVVHRTGHDAEADRRTGDLLRRIEYHQARSQHHPDKKVRAKSAEQAWRLAERVGRGDSRLTTRLTASYTDRAGAPALAALDALYGRTPAEVGLRPLPAPEPVPAIAAAPQPTPALVQVPAPARQSAPEPEPVPVPEARREEVPGQMLFEEADTDPGTAADTADEVEEEAPQEQPIPQPGVQLADIELDMVVLMIRSETNPPRSFREMETRFRELGYIGGADRLRAAWKRVTESDPIALEG
ncbi:hypothetical protein ACGF0D_42705 [Kitasatospora sp. NPDC048298]|uniref:hypothetical protein n=1 Tax=Kitasatospora sp. NPDC048298 TaxID=3364049 RepID=UPI0037199B78